MPCVSVKQLRSTEHRVPDRLCVTFLFVSHHLFLWATKSAEPGFVFRIHHEAIASALAGYVTELLWVDVPVEATAVRRIQIGHL